MNLIYKCSHCDEMTKTCSAMILHEKGCVFNPKNKNCFGCKHHRVIRGGFPRKSLCKIKLDTDKAKQKQDGFCIGWQKKE